MLYTSTRFVVVFVFLILSFLQEGLSQSIEKKASTTIKKSSFTHWYVSINGDDNNSGKSLQASFKTLRKASELVGPGDVVLIANGVYTDTNRTDKSAVLSITKSGLPNAWITWRAIPGHHPQIHPVGWNGIAVSASYNVLDGLTIVGANDSLTLLAALNDAKKSEPNPVFNTNGITVEGRRNAPGAKPHHIVIRNCSVSKCPGGGIAVLEADYVTIEDCRVFENAWYMRFGGSGITTLNNWAFDDRPGYHIVIQRNLVWNNKTLVPWNVTGNLSDGNGILLDVTDLKTGATNPNADSTVVAKAEASEKPVRPEWKGRALIANNVSAYNGGSGIHTFCTKHVDIINNTTYWNGQVVGYQELFPNRSDDVVILNNIIVPRPGGKVTSDNRNTNIKWNYNLYSKLQNVFSGKNDIVGDPLFEGVPTYLTIGSFKLKKGSPGLNNATNEIPQSVDISGKKRPPDIGRDRGAHEQ